MRHVAAVAPLFPGHEGGPSRRPATARSTQAWLRRAAELVAVAHLSGGWTQPGLVTRTARTETGEDTRRVSTAVEGLDDVLGGGLDAEWCSARAAPWHALRQASGCSRTDHVRFRGIKRFRRARPGATAPMWVVGRLAER